MTAFHTNPRKSLTDQQKAKLFLERGGRCHRCKRKLGPADVWIVEHVQALENGGTNDWENLTVTCAWCLPEKNLRLRLGSCRQSQTQPRRNCNGDRSGSPPPRSPQ